MKMDKIIREFFEWRDVTKPIGSWSQKYGLFGSQPSHFFMYEDLENVLLPYGGVTPPDPEPSFTPISKRGGLSSISQTGKILN